MSERAISVVGIGGCGRAIVREMVLRGDLRKRCPAGSTAFSIVDAYPFAEAGEIAVLNEGSGNVVPGCCPEARAELREAVGNTPLVLLAAGMGGATGTTLAPVIGKMAREADALVIGLVSLPCPSEGCERGKRALEGLASLRDVVDTLIVAPGGVEGVQGKDFGEGLRAVCRTCADVGVAFHEDLLLHNRIASDLADYKEIFRNGRLAVAGIGRGSGPECGRRAAEEALGGLSAAGMLPEFVVAVFLHVRLSPNVSIESLVECSDVVRGTFHEDVPFYLGVTHADSSEEDFHAVLVAMRDLSFGHGADGFRPGENSPFLSL